MGKLNNVSDHKYFYRSQGNVFFHGRGSDCLLKVCRVKQVYECAESNVKKDAQLYELISAMLVVKIAVQMIVFRVY